ncbi:hypothetical protein BGZ75_008208 [Mortierella antarctica]|nr:hypothetical protein BGZ67_002481 [Mortierella alpina]KAF9988914.1 hypothetical protein BGZ75_008208 [Mortierella antarctica]
MSQPPAASSPQSLLWEAFRADPSASDLYLPDSHIVFLPTGAGAAGEKLIRDFYQSGGYSHPKKLAVEETTIHRTVGESSAVDEVEVTVKFASGAGGWLLPGIEPHHLEDLTITFPLVICASFHEDHIASVRYMWDNASVLKMVRLIGSRHSWPIVAETQVDALRNPSRFRLNPFGNATSSTAGSRPQTGISNIFSAPPPLSPPPSAGAQAGQTPKKGHPALTSTVFSHLRNAPLETRNNHDQSSLTPISPTSPVDKPLGDKIPSPTKKGHPALTSTLFNHLSKTNPNQIYEEETNGHRSNSNSQPATTANNHSDAAVKKKGHPALTSTLFNHLKEQPQESAQPARKSPPPQQEQQQQQPEEERGAGWRADYVKPKGHPALTSTLFSQPAHTPPPAVSRPYKKTSHNIFGPPPPSTTVTATEPAQPVIAESVVEEPQEQEETSSYASEAVVMEAELERHERQQEELKEAIIQAAAAAEEQQKAEEALAKEVQALEELAIHEKALEEEELKAQKEKEEAAALALASPVVTPPRKLHPNYRTSFTIGGPR